MSELRYRVTTLGCRVNRADSLQIETELQARGMSRATPGEDPDVWVVNTCAVTAEGMRKSRKAVRKAAVSGARVLVTGCGTDYDRSAWTSARPSDVFSNRDKGSMIETAMGPDRLGVSFCEVTPEELVRVPVKVQDGCDRYCAYCVVPYLRPPPCSTTSSEVLRRIEGLAARGAGEVILCGIDLGSYRDPETGAGLGELVDRASAVCAGMWLRLSSIELSDVDTGIVEQIKGGALCPHLHLPLQSGSEEVLASMGRGYSTLQFARKVEGLRSEVSGLSISGDVMVGFPGETEEQHAESLEFVESMGFSRLHIFKYSPRPGTRAYSMGDTVAPGTKDERADQMRTVADGCAMRFHDGFVGRIIQVLVEGPLKTRPGHVFGRSRSFAGVVFPGSIELTGARVDVVVTSADAEGLEGRLLADGC